MRLIRITIVVVWVLAFVVGRCLSNLINPRKWLEVFTEALSD